MARVTWLHLSDWHQKGEDFNRQVVRDKLLDDLRNREEIDPALARVDFVVFSGDLAWSGQTKEYEAARKHFLDPVLRAVDLGPERLFLVPGNHDLDRAGIAELPPVLQQVLRDEQTVAERLTDDRRRARSLEPMGAYAAFAESYVQQPSAHYASLREWTIDGCRVALLGLNSAWMCGRNKRKKEIDDYGHLVVGEPQIHDALDRMKDANLRIVVMHHPFEWLKDFDRNRVEARLLKGAHFLLRGHTHDPKVLPQSGTDGACIVIPAGATYDRRTSDQRYANAYNFVDLDLDTGRGRVLLRRWSDTQTAWRADVDTQTDGVFSFRLPKLSAGSSKARGNRGSGRVATAAAKAARAEKQEAAETRYRELLLETCDIVDLAGLPEDRAIVQRRLELRRLYMPLRARVEAPVGEEVADSRWQGVEARRDAARSDRTPNGTDSVEEKKPVPIGERLREARRLVILGDPGAGKTTLTRWLATAYLLRLKKDPDWKDLHDVQTLPDANWLPIVVRCRDLNDDCLAGTLDDILQHTFRKAEMSSEEGTVLVPVLRERLTAGTGLLILDGLDEIADPKARARFCEQIERVVVAYPRAPVIATSRVVGYREMGYRLGREFEHLVLADLTREEKDHFAARWCAFTELPDRSDRAAADLMRDIHSNDRIERMTGNPMLLTTMALVRRKIGRLPNRRVDLYYEALQVLLHWRTSVDTGEAIDWQEAVPQLEYLAHAMCDMGIQRLPREDVLALFAEMRSRYPNIHAVRKRSAEEFLRAVEARTGILVEAGHVRHMGTVVPVYEFRHLTFQEYLAARALVDGKFRGHDPSQSLAQQIAPLTSRMRAEQFSEHGPSEMAVIESWREPLRLCVTMCQDAEVDAVVQTILSVDGGESTAVRRARAIQAMLCLADEPNVSESVADSVMRAFVARVQNRDGKGFVRTAADVAAAAIAITRWGGPLRRVLVDKFCTRGSEARYRYGGLAAMMISLSLPTAFDVHDWITTCGSELATADNHRAVELALGASALAFQWRLTESNAGPQVRTTASHLLYRLEGGEAFRAAAALTLGWMSNRANWQPTGDEAAQLAQQLRRADLDADSARWIVEILGRARAKGAVADLLAVLTRSSGRLRESTLEALGRIGEEPALAAIRAHLRDRRHSVRETALSALALNVDRIDGCLLTCDVDGRAPYLDPAQPITEKLVQKAAAKLSLPIDDVRARYSTLAAEFGLILAFDAHGSKPPAKRRRRAPMA